MHGYLGDIMLNFSFDLNKRVVCYISFKISFCDDFLLTLMLLAKRLMRLVGQLNLDIVPVQGLNPLHVLASQYPLYLTYYCAKFSHHLIITLRNSNIDKSNDEINFTGFIS